MRWNQNDINPKSVWQILYQILARVGIRLYTPVSVPVSNPMSNFYPDLTINPGTPGDTALRRLLSFVPDGLIFTGQQAFVKNPLPDEASCYSYVAPAIASASAGHPILSGQYSVSVSVSRTRAIGQDQDGNRIVEEALDSDLSELGIDILEQVYDPNLSDATGTQERADALLRQASLRAERGNLVIPTNVGQELYDVITVTDARCGIEQVKYRVLAIQTDYDHRQGTYTQHLGLCAP